MDIFSAYLLCKPALQMYKHCAVGKIYTPIFYFEKVVNIVIWERELVQKYKLTYAHTDFLNSIPIPMISLVILWATIYPFDLV